MQQHQIPKQSIVYTPETHFNLDLWYCERNEQKKAGLSNVWKNANQVTR